MKTFCTLVLLGFLHTCLVAAPRSLFDGKSFAGWEGDTNKWWRLDQGALVGGSLKQRVPHNDFLAFDRPFTNFVLRAEFRLLGTDGFVNSGIQIRSQRVPNSHEMSGYQCDIGDPTWWGALYDESRRNKVLAASDMEAINKVLKRNEWNEYVIRAEGRRIRTYINGALGVDYTEPDRAIPQWGRIGMQIHGGGAGEAWFKNITIEELPASSDTPPSGKEDQASRPPSSAGWSGLHGGVAQGVSDESRLPVTWSADDNVLWEIGLPGWGDSSPIVVGDRIYLTSQTDNHDLHVLAMDRDTGKQLWIRNVGSGKGKTHELQNMATPTPVSDGHHVWAYFGTGLLVCLDKAGNVVWNRDLQRDQGPFNIQWGMATSPVLHEGSLYIACLHSGPSYVLAMDAATGKDRWKTDRNIGPENEARDVYSTPIIHQGQLVVSGANHLNAYDLDTGKPQWICGGLEVTHPYGRTISGPTAFGETIVTVASGFRNQGHVMAVKTGGQGDISASHTLWTVNRYSPDCPSPVIYRGLVYFIRDDGMASCVDLETGEPHWQERLVSGNIKISPVAGDGKIYFLNNQANCTVIKAGPELEVLGTNELNEETLCGPAISGGRLFIRTREHLRAIGAAARSAAAL